MNDDSGDEHQASGTQPNNSAPDHWWTYDQGQSADAGYLHGQPSPPPINDIYTRPDPTVGIPTPLSPEEEQARVWALVEDFARGS